MSDALPETALKAQQVYELLAEAARQIDAQNYGTAKGLIREAQHATGHRPDPVGYRG